MTLVAAALMAMLAILSSVVFHGGADAEVSDTADRFLGARFKPNYFLHFLGPFRFLTYSKMSEISTARQRVGWVAVAYQYEAWTKDGLKRLCDNLEQIYEVEAYPRYPILPLPEGVTYRDLIEVDNEYRHVISTVADALPTVCWNLPYEKVQVRFVPPTYDISGKDGSQIYIRPPELIVANIGTETVDNVKVLWEVGVLGRDKIVATGIAEETIPGGLMHEEIYRIKNTGWTSSNNSELQAIASRLSDIEFYILACVWDGTFVIGESPGRRGLTEVESNCLGENKYFSSTLLEFSILAPKIEQLMTDPRLTLHGT